MAKPPVKPDRDSASDADWQMARHREDALKVLLETSSPAAVAEGCREHSISLTYRPPQTPHYGGHIERLIGTMMGELHLLPGSTFSSIKDRGECS